MQIRCLIVDDNQPFLDAVRLLLEREGVAVVGVATTSTDALRLERELQPDVVLVDIRLGDESGFDLAQRLSGTVILHQRAERVRRGDRGEPGGGIHSQGSTVGVGGLCVVGRPIE